MATTKPALKRIADDFKRLSLAANLYTYATPEAIDALSEAGQETAEFINRHQQGDWDDLCEEDEREPEFSVDKRLRIFSAYKRSSS